MYVTNKPAEFLILCECVLSILENLIYLPSIIKLCYGVMEWKCSCKNSILFIYLFLFPKYANEKLFWK